jgi:hypothetical protein
LEDLDENFDIDFDTVEEPPKPVETPKQETEPAKA